MVRANISWNARQIGKAATQGSMTFDNAIQRGNVWTAKQQCEFIESLIHNYPVPPMYTVKTDIDAPEGCKKGSKVFDCIDGKQRCEAIRKFSAGELALEGLKLPWYDNAGEEVDLNGCTIDTLPEEAREAFEAYTLTVYFFTDITDDEIAEMMSRLNNGKELKGVEKARIKAKNLPAIINLANHELFQRVMTEKARAGYNNEDVVIKTALQVFDEQFELSVKNVKETYESMEFTPEQANKLSEMFTVALNSLDAMEEVAKKPVYRKAIKKTNLVNIIYLCSEVTDYELVGDFLAEFFDSNEDCAFADKRDEYNEACTDGTNHANNVVARNKAMKEAYDVYVS